MKPTYTIRPHLLRALLLGAAAVACQGAEGKSKDAAAGAGGMPPMPVEVVAARADTVVDAILATGQIEAMQSVELRPDIEGRIAEILVREGATVARGAPLFKVDDAELRAEVARAEADRDLARQSLARTRELLGQKASSQSELERAEATSRSTEAQLALLKVRLDRTVVRAPFAGVAGERHVSLGDYVTTSTPLLTVQTVSPQRASFQVPERYADQLEVGQQVTFRVAALVAGFVPLVLALRISGLNVSTVVGLAFAVAASSFCPLLVLGIWWRGLTAPGAAAGIVTSAPIRMTGFFTRLLNPFLRS